MLVLTRKSATAIRIGEDICITVVGIKGNQVRLGVTAPTSMPVHRQEIFERIAVDKKTKA